jgi:hypothetical protein
MTRRTLLQGIFGALVGTLISSSLFKQPEPVVLKKPVPLTREEIQAQREAIIAKALDISEGRKALAEAMTAPLVCGLMYNTVGKKLLTEK